MCRGYYELSADFNPVLLKKFLLEIHVPSEMEVRLGVPAGRLEQWLHDLAGLLCGMPQPPQVDNRPQQPEILSGHCHCILSAEEIRLLLC
ncbi:MAG: hypothetical protein GX043_03020 [Desulfovibrionales bacterium]|nr:hypothetical protein [Desulfovibrionales bacterium]